MSNAVLALGVPSSCRSTPYTMRIRCWRVIPVNRLHGAATRHAVPCGRLEVRLAAALTAGLGWWRSAAAMLSRSSSYARHVQCKRPPPGRAVGRPSGERPVGDPGKAWRIAVYRVRNRSLCRLVDARYLLRLDDGALTYQQTYGYRHGPPDVLAEIGRGAVVDPARYYFRMRMTFETASRTYRWLTLRSWSVRPCSWRTPWSTTRTWSPDRIAALASSAPPCCVSDASDMS
jgi:hypothetical protein